MYRVLRMFLHWCFSPGKRDQLWRVHWNRVIQLGWCNLPDSVSPSKFDTGTASPRRKADFKSNLLDRRPVCHQVQLHTNCKR